MRSILALAACSVFALALPVACTTTTIVQQPAPIPEEPPVEEEAPPPATPVTPGGIDPLVVDLGSVQTGTDVTFDIPDGALGFNITAEGKVADFDQSAPFGILRITDPSGKIVHDNFTPKGGTKETSTAAFDVIASASVPQGDGVGQALGGKWKVRFGVFGSPSSKITLKGKVRVQSSGDGAFHGGKLSLNIHVPTGLRIGNSTIDASKASSNAALKERIDTFFQLTGQLLNIDKGDVVFTVEPASFAELDGVEELLQGFAISSGEKDGTQALHVLLTNLIAQDGQPFAAGISPGIPGAATIFGRNVSGIIITTSPSPEQDALTMAHEAGHFFGLNHTTEFDGQSSDPLSDTPVCSDISKENLTGCPDRTNIMFAAGAIDGPISLSPTQKRVYQGSPIYKAFTTTSTKGNTMAWTPPSKAMTVHRQYRVSGNALSPVERDLSLGFCGLNPLDVEGLVRRHGQAQAVAELRAAASDQDLAPFIRGRANLALAKLGAK